MSKLLVGLTVLYGFAVPIDFLLGASVEWMRNEECREVMGHEGVNVVPVAWMFATGLCGLVFGDWLARTRTKSFGAEEDDQTLNVEPLVWSFLFTFAIEFFYFYSRFGGFAAYWSQSRIDALAAAQRVGGTIPYAPALIGAVVALRLDANQGTMAARVATVVTSSVTVVSLLIAGSRMEALLVTLPWFFDLRTAKSEQTHFGVHLRASIVRVTFAAAALSALVWLQHGRTETTQWLRNGAVQSTAVDVLDVEDYRPINIEFGGLYCAHAFYVANPNEQALLGGSYVSALGWALPTMVWRAFGEAKPPRVADAAISRWIKSADSYGFSFFLEAVINFGPLGPVFVGAALGAIAAYCERARTATAKLLVGIGSSLVIYVVRSNAEIFAVTVTGTLISTLPGFALALPFVRRSGRTGFAAHG